jgi:hypothetical protein
MISVSVSQAIKAPREAVMALYANYRNWDRLFPYDFRQLSPETIELWEDKWKYSGTFRNTFQAAPDGTRYTIEAQIELKGIYRLLGPFVGGYIRATIRRYVIEPLKAVAERSLT